MGGLIKNKTLSVILSLYQYNLKKNLTIHHVDCFNTNKKQLNFYRENLCINQFLCCSIICYTFIVKHFGIFTSEKCSVNTFYLLKSFNTVLIVLCLLKLFL